MTDSSVQSKREDLVKLIDHVKILNVNDKNVPAMKCVIIRLTAEMRRFEVEEMRRHIMGFSGLSSNSSALQTAKRALEEAVEIIETEERKLTNISLFGSSTRTLETAFNHSSRISVNTSPDSSVSSDSDLMMNTNTADIAAIAPHIETKTTEPRKKARKKVKSSWIGAFFRTLLLDLPYASAVLILLLSLCAKHMYFTFWDPVMTSVTWTKDRKLTEYTSYLRECSASDISTTNIDDVIIDPSSTTPEEALHITNKHGMSIFQDVLTPETAANMRKWVMERNANLSDDDEIPLISQKQRWSFPIGADQDPSVPPVLREIANHALLQDTMDLVMGEDPALVEFTAITAAYGAGDQHWHADNDFTASQMHYARSFVPMYSLFIPLQDTTAAMGATSACPGTHHCGEQSNLDDVCNKLNFQVHDSRGRLAESEEDHIWKTGDVFLMNLNLYHRGPGHTDPHGTERVMLIMTVSNRPEGPYFDRRQISLGTSYSNKWDMWGMTMKDLAVIETMVKFPWKQLLTYGVWKPKGNHRSHNVKWGWDYFTVACSRIVNEQMGFRYDDLEIFVNKMKKFGPLGEYLFGYLPEESFYDEDTETTDTGWREYFSVTLQRCVYAATGLYIAICFYFLIVGLVTTGISTFKRGFQITAFLTILVYGWVYYVSNTAWGKDIISGRLNDSPFLDVTETIVQPTTLPTKYDVLFNKRLNSPFLANMNTIYDHQIGNTNFLSLISKYSGAFSKSFSTAPFLQETIIKKITEKIYGNRGRFLESNASGNWIKPSPKEVDTIIRKQLIAESNPILKRMRQEIEYLKSECSFGRNRKTAMMNVHAQAYMEDIDDIIFDTQVEQEMVSIKPSSLKPGLNSISNINKADRKVATKMPKSTSASGKKNILKVDDIVEYEFAGEGWYRGRLVEIRKKRCTIAFDDGDYQPDLLLKSVRLFKPYQPGEIVAAYGQEYSFVSAKANGSVILKAAGDDLYSIVWMSGILRLI
mmetsp:Transcript_1779/g.2175  ORF Transcript_1779/g.2175 Transcript_1779/m.2175 type:complete len:985 (-) Transcript_1779:97-3051(-)